MKSLIVILASLIGINAQAMSIGTIYAETDPRSRGLTPIKVDAAACDSVRNPTECTLYVLGNRGKVKRFTVDKIDARYTYISASQREITVRDVPAEDIQILLNLGVALEQLGQDCTSVLVLESGSAKIIQLHPGCDI